MRFLNYAVLDALDAAAFQATEPYPWVNPEGVLTDEGFAVLRASLPPVERMEPVFGVRRAHGQRPHDRLALEYRDDLDVAEPWHAFVRELRGERYGAFLRRLFGRGRLRLNFHWHYTPRGASVSPHCDARHKLGSHIFYFSTPEDWRPEWGGETIVLDDGGRFPRRSAPDFADFDRAIPAEALGNRSFLFARRDKSWHGVRELTCPEGRYRKVFIVVVNDALRLWRKNAVRRLKGQAPVTY